MSTWVLSDHATGIFVSFQLEVFSAQKVVEEKHLRLESTVGLWWVSKKKLDTTEAARRGVEKAKLPGAKVDTVRHRIRRTLHGKTGGTRAGLLSEEAENFLLKLFAAFESLGNPLGAHDLRSNDGLSDHVLACRQETPNVKS